MSNNMVSVPAEALRQVIGALIGPPHYIRELQVIRNLPGADDPISQLITAYNAWVDEYNRANGFTNEPSNQGEQQCEDV